MPLRAAAKRKQPAGAAGKRKAAPAAGGAPKKARGSGRGGGGKSAGGVGKNGDAQPAAPKRRGAPAPAAAAASPAAAAAAAPAAAGAAGRPPKLYVVRCSHSTGVIDIGEGAFVDCWGLEVDAARESVEADASAHDGKWLAGEGAGHKGRPKVHASLAAAEAAGRAEFVEMVERHPFEARAKRGRPVPEGPRGEGFAAAADRFGKRLAGGRRRWAHRGEYVLESYIDEAEEDRYTTVESAVAVEVVEVDVAE